jgi:hypothetical protein
MPRKLEPEDFYKTPEGFIVFTEKYHLNAATAAKAVASTAPMALIRIRARSGSR